MNKSSTYLNVFRRCLIFYGVPSYKRLRYYILGLLPSKTHANKLSERLSHLLVKDRGLVYRMPKEIIWLVASNYYALSRSKVVCDKFLGYELCTNSKRLLNTEIYNLHRFLYWCD